MAHHPPRERVCVLSNEPIPDQEAHEQISHAKTYDANPHSATERVPYKEAHEQVADAKTYDEIPHSPAHPVNCVSMTASLSLKSSNGIVGACDLK